MSDDQVVRVLGTGAEAAIAAGRELGVIVQTEDAEVEVEEAVEAEVPARELGTEV